MKKLLYIIYTLIPVLALGQSQDQNYILSKTYKQPVTTSISTPTIQQANVQVNYYDGLGRLIQQVAHKQASNGKDIVTHIEYDAFGRQAKDYLPFTRPHSLDYLDANSALSEISSFYQYYNGGTSNPYSEKLIENSPLNRVIKQASPGDAWALNSGHEIKFDYDLNSLSDEVYNFRANRTIGTDVYNYSLNCSGYNNPNTLYKNISKNENWIASDNKNNTTEEYKNNLGQVILKRSYNNSQKFDTYYIYDVVGNLIYVSPPKASMNIAEVQTNQVPYVYSQSINISEFLLDTNGSPISNGGGSMTISIQNSSINISISAGWSGLATFDLAKQYEINAIYAIPDMTIGYVDFNYSGNHQYVVKIQNNKLFFEDFTPNTPPFQFNQSAISISQNLTQPLNSSLFGTTTAYSYSTNFSEIEELGYQYKYDNRNRLVEKKLPGKQWEFIVYDKLDRPIATGPVFSPFGDGSTGWMITKYDAFNRPILTAWQAGSVTTTTRKNIQDARNAQTSNFSETKTTASTTMNNVAFRYSNVAYPTTGYHVLTINYYDDYLFPHSDLINTNVTGATLATNVKGLPTGSWVRVLQGVSDIKAELSYVLYDTKYRPVRNYTKNFFGGYTQVDASLDWAGKVMQTITKHKRTDSDTENTITETFEYTPQDRLSSHTHQINSQAEEKLSENSYDELGQLILKTTGGGLQDVDYRYNIRGWLTAINDEEVAVSQDGFVHPGEGDLFAFKISYENLLNRLENSTGLFNGNISETFWKTSTDNVERQYGYEYDALNRLTKANFYNHGNPEEETMFNETLMYDPNGNIMNLERMGKIQYYSQPIDQLTYIYEGNQLKRVIDDSGSPQGFSDGNTSGDDYDYDENGNMIFDLNKGIELIKYNHLNLPTQINFVNQNNIEYIYNAVGQKVKKKVKSGSEYVDTDYLGGFQYRSSYTSAQGNQGEVILQYFPHTEGYVQHVEGKFFYVYNYTDHLGNIRLSYTYDENTGLIKIMEENHYYPFGLKHDSYNTNRLGYSSYTDEDEITSYVLDEQPKFIGDGSYNYKFNQREYQDELGLNVTAMDFRMYDNALGRFNSIDRLSEMTYPVTPYRFAFNNPVVFTDPSGLSEQSGNDLMGWVKTGNSVFWDPNVNNQDDIDRLYNGQGYEYVPDYSVVTDANGNNRELMPDGSSPILLNEVVLTGTKTERTAIDYFGYFENNYNGLNDILLGTGMTQIQNGYNNNYAYFNRQYYNFYKANKGKLNIPKPGQQRQMLKKLLSTSKFSKTSKLIKGAGVLGAGLTVTNIAIDGADGSLKASSIIDGSLLLGGATASAIFPPAAPFIATGILIYGIADYIFEINDAIDANTNEVKIMD